MNDTKTKPEPEEDEDDLPPEPPLVLPTELPGASEILGGGATTPLSACSADARLIGETVLMLAREVRALREDLTMQFIDPEQDGALVKAADRIASALEDSDGDSLLALLIGRFEDEKGDSLLEKLLDKLGKR